MTPYTLRPALSEDADAILTLLESSALPTQDLHGTWWQNFTVAIAANGEPIGVMGIDVVGDWGLVRSAAVAAEHRNGGIGLELLHAIESLARDLGLHELGLLTTTAEAFFIRHGYAEIPREAAPAAMQATAEFRDLCPDTATILRKSLRPAPETTL